MNGDFATLQSEKLAQQIVAASEDPAAQITLAWQLCYSRSVRPDEIDDATQFVATAAANYAEQNTKSNAAAQRLFGMTNLCHALMSGNEFLYIE